MKFKFSLPLITFLLCHSLLPAQQSWWVFFTDKQGVSFDPVSYFDPKAIERRIRHGIPLSDPTDWPVKGQYLSSVESMADSVLFVSRWFNAVAIQASEERIQRIRQYPFISQVEKINPVERYTAGMMDFKIPMNVEDSLLMVHQLLSLQGELFEKKGIDGKGIRIAIFDIGFTGVKENPAFQEIIASGRLIGTKDFTKRKGEDVFWGKPHGTQVWSCIAGKIGDKKLGLATGAEFLLAKTEVNREPFSEELNWLAAAEWADKMGADIINSSLGYTLQRYFPWQMDGRTSFVTRAANLAARKGILVVNSAGNEGSGDWHTLGAPADADSVLTIGGIKPETGFHTDFSSFGPTADKRMKPNVCAFGHVIVSEGGKLANTQGTSFASPLVAGFAACALQLNKKLTNMELFREIEKSGHLYPYFDYAHGFGVPQAGYFLRDGEEKITPTFTIEETTDEIKVLVREEFIPQPENKENEVDSVKFNKNRYLYYNIMNAKGVLDYYYILEVNEQEVLMLDRTVYAEGETLNVHFAGYTQSIRF